jgi:WD40 repeat protein
LGVTRQLILLLSLAFALAARAADPTTTQRTISFRRDVAPILLDQCQQCHGPDKAKGAYRLDNYNRLLTPGDSKDAPVAPGKPDASSIYHLITTPDEDDRMPQKADPLAKANVATIRRWIEQGASFDGPDRAAPLASLVTDREHPAPPKTYPQPIAVTALAFNSDGTELAVSGYHEITLWNPADGQLVGRIPRIAERTCALAYSADGKTLAIAGGAPGTLGEVRLCDPITRQPGKVIDRITDLMLTVRYSPDGSRLAAGGADSAIRLYDAHTAKRQRLIEQHADWVTDLAFSPDGTRLASASRDKSSRIFDVQSGAMLTAFLLHEEPIIGVAWSPDGKSCYTAGRDRKLRLWHAADAKPVDPATNLDADPLRLETSAGHLFLAQTDGTLRQYGLEKRDLLRTYPKASDWLYCIAIDAKHHRLAAGTYTGEVLIWDTDTGAPLTSFIASPGYVSKKN